MEPSTQQLLLKDHKRLVTLLQCAFMAALVSVCAQISIPLPGGVPMTLQTFGIALTAFLFGSRKAVSVIGLYLALGLVGLPVFAGGKGGVQILLGPSGGFLFGFLFLAFLGGLRRFRFPAAMAGLLACYGLGVLQLAFILNLSLRAAFMAGCLPFLLKDSASILLAYLLSRELERALKAAGLKFLQHDAGVQRKEPS